MDKTQRIKELSALLNEAAQAYYTENRELMSNFEYDALYDELEQLEVETGLILADSPTQKVGSEIAKELVKETHETPMLSLDKTKEPAVLKTFLKGQKGLLSWKLDGLTVVLTYENGTLVKGVTRGNGEIGEVITANVKKFQNVPIAIPYQGKLVVRGEAVIRYSDFKRINEELPETEAKYKNPRNLCSGAVRQLDPQITAKRSVQFYAFSLESAEVDFENRNENKFKWLKDQGFAVVPYYLVDEASIEARIAGFEAEIQTFDIPSDGLVLLLDDIAYGKQLGVTAKFPKNAIAFKWKDETAETTLTQIEWSPSRTGLINPIAVFAPVELEGTTVSRASLHNVSICEDLQLGTGDRLTVYKANMIIPQIAQNLTKSGSFQVPDACPACGGKTAVRSENGVKTLHCPNPECPAKKIKTFSHFVSRNAMNIDGISEETLEKFIAVGYISEFADIYRLDRFQKDIEQMYGFGEKSYRNMIASVNASRRTTAARLLNALGIGGIGASNAKVICRYFQEDFQRIMEADREELLNIEGIGAIIADTMVDWFADPSNKERTIRLLSELELEKSGPAEQNDKLAGLTFVITGSLHSYPNREALKEEIEAAGGKVAGSVSAKTSYLINNDIHSTSGKNRDAKSKQIPIITEDEYKKLFKEENQ